jgi:hypothetical protein
MSTHPISAEEFHNYMDTERGADGPLKGFYWMVHSHERNAMLQYHFINWLINLLLILEAALSAVFVALGASGNQYQKLVAILGAVNGVITGVLAIIKGQGLPGRFYQHASGLREVIREIGRLERIVASNGKVTREDCENLYSMYNRVQREYDTHSPDIREIDTPPLPQIASGQHGEERLILNSGEGSETGRLLDSDGA